jgi:hypothetical protein
MKNYKQITVYDILNDVSTTVTTPDVSEGVKELFNAVSSADLSRSKNYIINEEFKSNTLCYTVTYIEDDFPALGSVVWTRPMYNGIIRLATRYCVHPNLLHKNFGKGTNGMRLDTLDHITQQIEFCKNLGYQDFFIGREDKTKGRRTKNIASTISKYTGMDWKVSEKEVLASMSPEDDQSWQYLIYNNRMDFNYENELRR